MGNDWGGRTAANPAGAPKVTREAVIKAAAVAGVEVKRQKGAWAMWWIRKPGDVWRTLASTNYLAHTSLLAMKRLRDQSLPEAALQGGAAVEVSIMTGRDFYDEVHRTQIKDRLKYLSSSWSDIGRETNLVARLNGQIIGAAGLQDSPDEERVVWLVFVAVAEAFWGLRVGSALAAAAFDYARDRGCRIRASSYTDLGAERLKRVLDRLASERPDVGFKDGSDHRKFDLDVA